MMCFEPRLFELLMLNKCLPLEIAITGIETETVLPEATVPVQLNVNFMLNREFPGGAKVGVLGDFPKMSISINSILPAAVQIRLSQGII